MKKLRWGLLSTARINRRLIPVIRASQHGELLAVASRELASARPYASQWEIPQAFGSYQELLDSDLVDIVYISLPNHLHAEWTIRALQAGKHVLCEKPLALSLEEVDQMTAASQRAGRVLMEAFMYRHHPQTKIAGELVKSGRLGDLCQVNAIFNFTMASRDNVRLVPEFGGGSLWDVGVYPISLSQYLLEGIPERVFGTQWIGPSGVDEAFAGQMIYPGNRVAQFSCSFRSPFHTEAEIIGTAGRLTFTRPFTHLDHERHLFFHPAEGDPVDIAVPEIELYLGEVENMHAAILDSVPPYLTLDESRNHIRTALALYQSAQTGTVVALTE